MDPITIIVLVVLTLFAGFILGIAAYFSVVSLRGHVKRLSHEIETLTRRVSYLESGPATRPAPPARAQPQAEREPAGAAPAEPPAALAPIPLIPETPSPQAPPKRTVAAAAEAAEKVADRLARLQFDRTSGAKTPAGEPPPPVPGASRLHIAPKATAEKPEWWSQFEKKAGKLWMTWAGALVLILCAGFFAKYAFDQGWIGPGARVILGAAVGVALVAAGERFLRRGMQPLGQGLMGAGVAILYVTLFAAYAFYSLIPRELAFGLMAVVTAGGMTLAVLHDALPVSILALVGGFLTPVMLRTGRDPRDMLFAYLLILDLGVLGVALFRKWRALDVLAFAGTWALYAAWHASFYDKAARGPALAWVGAFYAVFLVLPFANHLRRRTPITVERFLMALANAAAAIAFCSAILTLGHRQALSFISLGMGAIYTAMGIVTQRRIEQDRVAVFSFIALGVGFATGAVPFYFEAGGMVLAWAVEAPVLVYLGYRYRYIPVRVFGFVVLVLACARFFAAHWPLQHGGPFVVFLNMEFATAMCTVDAAVIFAVVHQVFRAKAGRADRVLKLTAGIAAGFMLLRILHAEVDDWFSLRSQYDLARAAAVTIWALGAVGFLLAGAFLKSLPTRLAGFLPLLVALCIGAGQYLPGSPGAYIILFNVRFASCLVVVLALFAYGLVPRRAKDGRAWDEILRTPAAILAGLLGLVLLHGEIAQWFGLHDQAYMGRIVLVFVWALGAVGFLAAGFKFDSRPARLAGTLPLGIGFLLAASLYSRQHAEEYALFLNMPFAAGLAAVLSVFAFGFAAKWYGRSLAENDRQLGYIMRACGTGVLLALLSAETYTYCIGAVASPERARWLAQMSLSVVWAVYAMALLVVGFWRATRPLRLAALSLFALTAVKVVMVDIANIKQIYRILALFILAVLMLGASYLYHRLEKRILATRGGEE